jgi:hypothetical protein
MRVIRTKSGRPRARVARAGVVVGGLLACTAIGAAAVSSAQAPHDDHTVTPPPTPEADAVTPTLDGVESHASQRTARVTFTLSEHATVTVRLHPRASRSVLRTVRVQARAGTRSVVLRGIKLRKGRYTVTLAARDAMGNVSATSTSALRIRK